ncbi:MAG TPA: tetratricopeptide repeat protein [Rugosimonospora sp.]|nr:tetratricopeptide repeat protein [Rugosimonospora sp.]
MLWPELDLAERYERAQHLFASEDYVTAGMLLADVVDAEPGHLAARLLLARAYYHSASLGRAEEQLRIILDTAPTEAYATLMLGRTLQRRGRGAEGETYLRMASAMRGKPLGE